MEAALSGLPSHGWTQGEFRRRDRCLLVLSQLAGVPYKHLATLTAGGLHIKDGVATIRSLAGEWTLRPADDGLLSGPCAIARWLKILDLAVTKPSTKTIARGLLASVDGIRFVVPVRTIHARPNPKYFGRKRGITWLNVLNDPSPASPTAAPASHPPSP